MFYHSLYSTVPDQKKTRKRVSELRGQALVCLSALDKKMA